MSFLVDIANGILGSKRFSKIATNRACNSTSARPNPFSLWSHVAKPPQPHIQGPVGEYTTWPMLTDRLFSARHLPPAAQSYVDNLPFDAPYNPNQGNPIVGDVTALFERQGAMTEDRSSILFMFFAQWFTDSVLRIDPTDRRKNTSNHNIDLCQIYGLTESTARILRLGVGGKLKSRPNANGEEMPEFLGTVDQNNTWRAKDEFAYRCECTHLSEEHVTEDCEITHQGLRYTAPQIFNNIYAHWQNSNDWPTRAAHLYATGLERGNSSIGYAAISTIFLREHNRICEVLASENPSWSTDDERLFQTARMINTVILMKLVVQDYINHIAGNDVFVFDPSYAEEEDWYRTPWISLEFDLLYRWHGLIPDTITVDGIAYNHESYRVNNGLLETAGLDAVITAASTQHAGKISLRNVPDFMLGAEYQMIKMGRDFRLMPYNAYREKFDLRPIRSFEQLTENPQLRNDLSALYGDIDNLEFTVGLFAEQSDDDGLYGDLMYKMVAYDAFTQIYSNPLLSQNVYNADTFTHYGLELIDETNSVQDLVDRNTSGNVIAKFSL